MHWMAASHESPFASIVGRRNGRTSTVWPMPIHCFAHGFGRTGEIGPMNDGALAAKYPMEGSVDAFDVHAGLM
jgi:hypothetical protein